MAERTVTQWLSTIDVVVAEIRTRWPDLMVKVSAVGFDIFENGNRIVEVHPYESEVMATSNSLVIKNEEVLFYVTPLVRCSLLPATDEETERVRIRTAMTQDELEAPRSPLQS